MKIVTVLQIVSTILLLSIGQVLFKIAADRINASASFISSIANPVLLSALAIYAVATVLWILCLRTTPLRLAYPFAALAFIFVPVMAHFVLSEPLKSNTIYGFLFIVSGVYISVMKG